MPSYTGYQRRAVADGAIGFRAETGTLAAATYLATGQQEYFNVTGAVMVTQLYIEVMSALSAHAAQVLFNCTFSTPSIAANAMCGKCASIASAARGLRVVWVGGAVATPAVITDSAGLSDVICVSPHIVGGEGFVGTVGSLTSDASITSGTIKVFVHWLPMTYDGNVTAAV